MTVEQSDQLRKQMYLKALNSRLEACEDEDEAEYIKEKIEDAKKIDQISPRDR